MFAGLVVALYLAYCIKQGVKELRNGNLELTYLKILAILIESFNVLAFIYILTQLSASDINLIPEFLIVAGMAYLLIQNIRILVGKIADSRR